MECASDEGMYARNIIWAQVPSSTRAEYLVLTKYFEEVRVNFSVNYYSRVSGG